MKEHTTPKVMCKQRLLVLSPHISQGSAHTGWEWSAPTTTQLFLPPLKLKIPDFYHHSERIIVYSMQYNTIFHYSLATTQIILGRTLISVSIFHIADGFQ